MASEIQNQINELNDTINLILEGDLESAIAGLRARVKFLERQERENQNAWDKLIVSSEIECGGATDKNTPESAIARLNAQGIDYHSGEFYQREKPEAPLRLIARADVAAHREKPEMVQIGEGAFSFPAGTKE